MIDISEKDKCSGCYACAAVCPKNCINMVSDNEGFWYPKIDNDACVRCGLCERVCPIINKWSSDNQQRPTAIAAINKNTEVRLNSSSGGIFSILAEWVLSKNGVVFGAAFDDSFQEVHHIFIENISDVDRLRGSKYVQSRIGDTYKEVKRFLTSGRLVLFTGTPCQIAGLYSFLGKDYEDLYTQDIICHGVPSPLVWRKYLHERESKAASKTKRMSFRHKKYGWKTFAVLFEFSNNSTYIKTLQEDSFMRAFLSNACLRPSCYSCSFKTVNRQADITLADFWGVHRVMPYMDDNKGTSIVLVHSKKGGLLLEYVTDELKYADLRIETIVKYNPALLHSSKKNEVRSLFMEDIECNSIEFDSLSKAYFPLSLKQKVRTSLDKIGITEWCRHKLKVKQ